MSEHLSLTTDPILTMGDDEDTAAQDAEARRIAPALTRLAIRLKSIARRGDIAALTRALDAELPVLHRLIADLITTRIRHAVHQAWDAAQICYRQAYGTYATRLLTMQAGNAEDVVDRILHLPDRWGYTYSDRLWTNLQTMRQELSTFMGRHVRESASLLEGVESLRQWQRDDPSLPRHMRDLEQAGRRLLTNVPGAKAAYVSALARARKVVITRVPGERGTQQFQRAVVQQIMRAVREGSQAAMDEAVDTFVSRRTRYRAQVLLRSEVSRAYGEGVLAEYQEHGFVQAVKWVRNPLHKHIDECDAKANADIGLGPGIYYKNFVPFPDHTSGRCKLDPILAPLSESLDAQPFVPQDPQQLTEVMQQLQGPLAREANRRGRLKDVQQHDFAPLLEQLPRIPPLSQAPRPLLPSVIDLAQDLPNTPAARAQLLRDLEEHIAMGRPMTFAGRLLTVMELQDLRVLLVRTMGRHA